LGILSAMMIEVIRKEMGTVSYLDGSLPDSISTTFEPLLDERCHGGGGSGESCADLGGGRRKLVEVEVQCAKHTDDGNCTLFRAHYLSARD